MKILATLFLILLPLPNGFAGGLDILGVYRKVRPQLVDRFSGFDNTTGAWSEITDSQTMIRNYDLEGYLNFPFIRTGMMTFYLGLYGVYTFPASNIQNATSATSGIAVKKTTALSGWLVGPFIQARMALFLEILLSAGVGVAGGTYSLNQTVDNGTEHSIKATAFSGEERIFMGLSRPLFGILNLGVQGGYSRQKSVAFKTESTSGSLYSAKTAGRVVQINDSAGTADLKLDRSGVFGSVSLSIMF